MNRILTATAAAVLACALGLAGCSQPSGGAGQEGAPSSNQQVSTTVVAATVNHDNIQESAVEAYITAFRESSMHLEEDGAWADWLEENNYTEESLRLAVIDSFIDDVLIRQAAADNGITANQSAVDEDLKAVKGNYPDEAAWQAALKDAGYSEEEYRAAIELSYLASDLRNKVVAQVQPTEEEFQAYANQNASRYDGKRLSVIYFTDANEQDAKDALVRVKAGEDFATLATELSWDPTTANKGGDLGWDCLNSTLPEAYVQALEELEPGETSEVIALEDGFAIIKCTDRFVAPAGDAVDLAAVPDEIEKVLRDEFIKQSWDDAFDAYVAGLRDQATITIYAKDGTVAQQLKPKTGAAAATTEAPAADAAAATDAAAQDAAAAQGDDEAAAQ